MAQILDVKNVHVFLDKEHVLQDISFTVQEKEVLVIVGPNGAGKTTLLKVLLNLVPYQGEVQWKTQDISYLPPQEFLYRKYLPPLSIEEFFLFKNVTLQQIETKFEEVGLDICFLKKQFGLLSTGQFQRMLVAWALVDEPLVLLFDEPTAGIDIGGEETIYSLLHKFWKEKGLTIILVTHNLNVVWEHASNVLCLNKKLLCYGRPEVILTQENLNKLYGAGVRGYEHRHAK